MSKVFSFILRMIDHPLNWHRLHQNFVTLLLAGGLMIAGGNAHAESHLFEGVMEYHDEDPMNSDRYFANVNFSLTEESTVSLKYTDFCQEFSRPTMTIHNAWGETAAAKIVLEDTPQPWGPLPLAPGTWTVRLDCGARGPDREPYPPFDIIPTPYKLGVISEPGQSQFAKDSEYTPVSTLNTPITLSSGKTYSGWLGYVGYEAIALNGDDYYHHGIDGADNYYFQAKAGTKIKIKLQYDANLNDALRERDIGFITYRVYENGNSSNYVPWDVVTDLNTMWQTSGDVSKEFTIPQDGTYLFRVFCGTRSNPGPSGMFPRTNYGGYKLSIIVNSEPEPSPSPGLYLTFESANWEKSSSTSHGYPYNLVINFQVENTHAKARIIRQFASVDAPGINVLPDNDRWTTDTSNRTDSLLSYFAMSAQCEESTDADWDRYCPNYRIPDDYIIDDLLEEQNCLHFWSEIVISPYYSIPASSIIDQTISIPATVAEYQNLDTSLQFLMLAIQDKETHPNGQGNDGCHLYGLDFRPIKGSPAAVMLLLMTD